ncbi:MAG TPA: hypothetical protein VFL28_15645 [bacterium]|nr:hypothetical protein [bacterium]
MTGLEHGIADVFASFDAWLVTTGATASIMRLAWAVLSVVWLAHIAVSTRPGREPDLVGAFARLLLVGGLLSGIGGLTRAILLGFETFRSAGAAVLDGLIGQTWSQFVQSTLIPQFGQMLRVSSAWFVYPWAIAVLVAGAGLGVVLFGIGTAVYLAILFFAHLTLLVALFLAPVAIALLAAPSTQRWTARWALIVVRVGLVVFCVRLVHAAALYLAVIVPFREVAAALPTDPQSGTGLAGFGAILWRLAVLLFLMLVGTVIGVYAMLRVERLVAQFVDSPSFGQSVLAGPMWARGQIAVAYARAARGVPEASVGAGAGGFLEQRAAADQGAGGAQDAAALRGSRRPWQ